MSSLLKILLGGAATAAVAWFLHGPMKFGEKCAAGATTVAAAPAAVEPVANTTVATPAAVNTCQTTVTNLMTGKTINFETSKAAIASSSAPLIDEIATALKGCAGVTVEVAGHTDSRGNDAANMALSEARAKAVVDALAAKGVAAGSMTAKGYGETKPLDTGTTSEALAKNRRIDFTVAASAAAASTAG
jgi:OmpA-OmpF porin, OOP family